MGSLTTGMFPPSATNTKGSSPGTPGRWRSSLKDGNLHREEDLPLILAGRGKGALRPGRRVRAAPLTPMCNLHLALLNRMGIMDKSFGDSTEPLKGLS